MFALLHCLSFSAAIALGPALKFNGGGHLNHSIFWKNLSPCATEPSAQLCAAINCSFGSVDKFKEQFSAVTVAVQGSGWGWLGYCPKTGNQLLLYALEVYLFLQFVTHTYAQNFVKIKGQNFTRWCWF